ncbi:MAG: helix-turn-helix domain-containing protein [Chloroflexota bacterium]
MPTQQKLQGEHLLKGDEVARILNISRSQAYKLMQQGEIPTVRIGRSVRVRYESLWNFIEENTTHKKHSPVGV